MTTITAFEAKTRFGDLLDRVSRGEEIVITRHDKPVARIVPEGRENRDRIRRAAADLTRLRERIRERAKGQPALASEEVRSAIEEGRR